MILEEIIAKLEEFCPPSFAEDWDNVGLQVGRTDKEVETILLALDCTSPVVEEAERLQADLILTHHPLLFSGIKQVTNTHYVGRRIVTLLGQDRALYAMHTNFDVMGMASEAAEMLGLLNAEVLSVTYEDPISREGLGRIGELAEHLSLAECAAFVKEVFGVSHVTYYGDPNQPIVSAAILPGSGKSEIDTALRAGADVLITGDITHHVGIDAVEKGIAVIDAGHYGVEKLFIPYMEAFIRREMPGIQVFRMPEEEPYHWI